MTNEEFNKLFEEEKLLWDEEAKRSREELKAYQASVEATGAIYITYPKFQSLTSYLVLVLKDDGRNFHEHYSRGNKFRSSPRYLYLEKKINDRLAELRVKYPSCLFHLERIFLEEKGYAKSTIEAKMRTIRKYQKNAHLEIAKRYEGKTNTQVIKEHK